MQEPSDLSLKVHPFFQPCGPLCMTSCRGDSRRSKITLSSHGPGAASSKPSVFAAWEGACYFWLILDVQAFPIATPKCRLGSVNFLNCNVLAALTLPCDKCSLRFACLCALSQSAVCSHELLCQCFETNTKAMGDSCGQNVQASNHS